MRTLAVSVFASLLTAVAAAQTVGVTGVNDFWITPGGLPNATSCAPLTINTPTTMNMNVTAAPGGPFFVFLSFCGCIPCAPLPAFGISSCLPGPTTACPASNQFLEANLFGGCLAIVTGGNVNTAGFGTLSLAVPLVSPPIVVGAQACFLFPAACLVAPFNVLVSPAWSVTLQ